MARGADRVDHAPWEPSRNRCLVGAGHSLTASYTHAARGCLRDPEMRAADPVAHHERALPLIIDRAQLNRPITRGHRPGVRSGSGRWPVGRASSRRWFACGGGRSRLGRQQRSRCPTAGKCTAAAIADSDSPHGTGLWHSGPTPWHPPRRRSRLGRAGTGWGASSSARGYPADRTPGERAGNRSRRGWRPPARQGCGRTGTFGCRGAVRPSGRGCK